MQLNAPKIQKHSLIYQTLLLYLFIFVLIQLFIYIILYLFIY